MKVKPLISSARDLVEICVRRRWLVTGLVVTAFVLCGVGMGAVNKQFFPKGYVAALKLDNGQVLTEASAILQYLADLQPAAHLAPANGSWERVRLQEWLNFIASEIHGGLAIFFNPAIQGDVRAMFVATLYKRFAVLVQTLERQDYLLGERYSVADAYLFVVLRWAGFHDIDLQQWPALTAFQQRVGARAAVTAALAAESA